MSRTRLIEWVRRAGAAEVALRCKVTITTIGRWMARKHLPATKHDAVDAAYEAWEAEQSAADAQP